MAKPYCLILQKNGSIFMKYLFRNDYSEICHSRVLEAIGRSMREQNIGYGLDIHSHNAANRIKEVFHCPYAEVHFLSGGTQTNMAMISYALRDFEAVIACDTGHINVHETGCIEATGHKVIAVRGRDGKVTPDSIREVLRQHQDEHWVKPRMVYISNSTEIGTIYRRRELEELSEMCRSNGLLLFIDGARIGAALTSEDNDISPEDISAFCDAFYIGGTKNGLMYGEALVIINEELKRDFRWHIKNKGAMLAKGYVVGIQFLEVFKDGLYFDLARNANKQAMFIREELLKLGVSVDYSTTNQLFMLLPRCEAMEVIDKFGCELWDDLGYNIRVRIVTSFATTDEASLYLIDYFKRKLTL